MNADGAMTGFMGDEPDNNNNSGVDEADQSDADDGAFF
jgi:hypothetical protein